MNRFVKMHARDMVATALVDLKKGETAHIYSTDNILIEECTALEHIPYGNKIALVSIKIEEQVIKYGANIGSCTRHITRGDLVHVHNVKSNVVDIPPVFKLEIMRQMGIGSQNEPVVVDSDSNDLIDLNGSGGLSNEL